MSGKHTMSPIADRLLQGKMEMEGLVPWGSNYTFLVHVTDEEGDLDAIYKPSNGERPLWDFARGTLCLRERAAYLVSEKLGWQLVPPTVLRDGPHGWGSVQYFVDHDPEQHYLTLNGRYSEQTRRIVLFDVLINNADRKSGHVLVGAGERLWAIDHGVCFHADHKLRSVIWEYSGEPYSEDVLADLLAFQTTMCSGNDPDYTEMTELLGPKEMESMMNRLEYLIEGRVFPSPGPGRHYPWPLI
jgi:uncharacterized repeat protein (TIGR03843 family)